MEESREVTIRQLCELFWQWMDGRVHEDMVIRLLGGKLKRDGTPLFSPLTSALLIAIASKEVTRERFAEFLRNPFALLSTAESVRVVPVTMSKECVSGLAEAERVVNDLPDWFWDAVERPVRNTVLICGTEVIVHRSCLGHLTVGQGIARIESSGKTPAGLDVLLAVAGADKTKNGPLIAAGTVVSHKGELMVSAGEYAVCVWYDKQGIGHLDTVALACETTYEASYLAIEPKRNSA